MDIKTTMDDDEFFIGYVELHSHTERALFHRDHIERLCKLAERPINCSHEWVAMHYENIKDLIDAARISIRQPNH